MISKRLTVLVCVVVIIGGRALCAAQSEGFFASWEDRVRATLAQQPSWPIPVVTASSGLLQVARTDFVRQIAPAGTDTWNYDNTKGFNVVPWYKNEEGGNYSVSFSLAGTMPTGSFKNGSLASTISPTLCAGKGFGRFDVAIDAGSNPARRRHDETRPRRGVERGDAVSHRQVFLAGDREQRDFLPWRPERRRKQNFVTPGLMLSKFKLERDPRNRLALMFGGGMQIATTQFHTYNHALVLTARMLF
ncbi:MAG: hypothetical protein ABSG23_10460 [Terriglobales bacterium]